MWSLEVLAITCTPDNAVRNQRSRDEVLGEVEKYSFTALPGKGETPGSALKNDVSTPEH